MDDSGTGGEEVGYGWGLTSALIEEEELVIYNGLWSHSLLAAGSSLVVAACDGIGDEVRLWILRCSLTWGGK